MKVVEFYDDIAMTENQINSILDKIKLNEAGLVVAIAQDCKTHDILMQAFMNKEAIKTTLQTGKVHYFSRSRNELWHKGATSGSTQTIVEFILDCDFDSILLKVKQDKPELGACHTGATSCFFNKIEDF